jgi:hypothetical protein
VSERPEDWYAKGGIVTSDDILATIRLRAGDHILTAGQIRAGHDYMKRTYGEPTNDAKDVD